MPKYKYNHPLEWLIQYLGTLDQAALLQEAFVLAGKLDGDQIQDLYQSEMVANGYFEPELQPADVRNAVGALLAKVQQSYDEFTSPDDAAEAALQSESLTDGERQILDALQNDDWLGFDYPHQALSALLSEAHNFDPSAELRQAIAQQY